MRKVQLYGIQISCESPQSTLEELTQALKRGERRIVYTPNFQIMSQASRDIKSKELLRSADMLIPDGIGISLMCRINKKGRAPRVTGIDTAHAILKYASAHSLSVFLLGAAPGVAELAEQRLCNELPTLNICGTHHGYFDRSLFSYENTAVLNKIRSTSPDILFVCFGFPAQEEWIQRNAPHLPGVRLFMGLGGSLDVWSGKVRRAPLCFRAFGLEWLWRCALEPKRFAKLFTGTK